MRQSDVQIHGSYACGLADPRRQRGIGRIGDILDKEQGVGYIDHAIAVYIAEGNVAVVRQNLIPLHF